MGASTDLFADPRYNRPNNEVLLNSLGATTAKELRLAEGRNIGQLGALVEGITPVPGQFDAAHLKRIHKELLGNIYPWAGQTRAWGQFQGVKYLPGRGTLFFAPYQQIDTRLDLLSGQLQKENNLRGLGKEQFVDRLAYYADQYNFVHPFREGNGRTLQVVMAELGRGAGYDVRLSQQQTEGQYNMARDTAILGKNAVDPSQNLQPLRQLLSAATEPSPGPAAEQLRHPDQARPLQQIAPALQQSDALRTLVIGSRELAEARIMQRFERHNYGVSLEYAESTRTQGGQLINAALDVQQEPATWPTFRTQLLAEVKQAEADKQTPRATTAHFERLRSAGQLLDTNQALTPAFQEKELPFAQLTKLGNPAELLWREGQAEKLLRGEKTAPLSLHIPNAQGQVQQVAMQLRLTRDPAGAVDMRVYLPQAIREAITQAPERRPDTQQQGAGTKKADSKPEEKQEPPRERRRRGPRH